MIQSLLKSFNLVSKPVKKEQLLKTFNTMSALIQENVLPSVVNVVKIEKSSKISKSDLYLTAKDICKIINYKPKAIFEELEKIFLSVEKLHPKIESLITKHTSTVLTDKVLSVKDAAIIKFVDDLSSLAMFTVDFALCVLTDPKNTSFPKIKFKKLKEGLPAFIENMKYFSKDLEKSIEKISKLDDTAITKDANHGLLGVKFKNDGIFGLLANGFINNPFYHIRMWLIDRDIAKLESLKDSKRLIELRIMELQVESKAGSDVDLTKQIEYYEDKLATLEYKIQKLEEV